MIRRITISILGLVVLAALTAALVGLLAPSVYTVDVVQAGLRQQPAAWVGRTVRVRGWVVAYDGVGCNGPLVTTTVVRWPSATTTLSPCHATWLVLSSANPAAAWSGSGQRSVTLATPALPVALPRGTRIPNLSMDGLAAILPQLPVVGPVLFRNVNSATLRVRLTTTSPACGGRSPCLGGALVP